MKGFLRLLAMELRLHLWMQPAVSPKSERDRLLRRPALHRG